MIYKATFTDKVGTEEIILKNDFNELSFEIDEVLISANCMYFEVEDYHNYTPEQLKRFILEPVDIFDSVEKSYELKDYTLSFTVPVTIYDFQEKENLSAELLVILAMKLVANDTRLTLMINKDDQEFTVTSFDFESAGFLLNEKISKLFTIKNCFWCSFSDYSIYGNQLFGSLRCFLKYKDQYLKVKTKDDYMDLPNDTPSVQEIYTCESFETRKKGTGYRG